MEVKEVKEHCEEGIYRNPCALKSTPFTSEECEALRVQPSSSSAEIQHNQMEIFMKDMNNMESGIEKYVHLMNLHFHNEQLFYYIIINKVELTMPIVYTPVVGQACRSFSKIFEKPKGLYISINDKDKIKEKLMEWPSVDIKAICVTDGERILGLGDLGTNGMGIPIGKLLLYTACARIPPSSCLPICLDVGTNNEKLWEEPTYKGIKKKRVTGDKYLAFLDEFMEVTKACYGPNVLVQFEDFGNRNAFALLKRYREKYCSFNDDIQGTAAVTVAALISSCKVAEKRLMEQKYLFVGAGEASIGIASLLASAMMSEGLSEKDAIARIWLVDSKGLVVEDRSVGGLNAEKMRFAHKFAEIETLEKIVEAVSPDVLIGAAGAAPGSFTQAVLEKMAHNHKRPVIFALSNPTNLSECTAEQAYKATKGRCVFASGSPFDPVTYKRKVFHPSQCNNAYIFPGIALSIVACNIFPITDGFFLQAAKILAKQASPDEIRSGMLFPPLVRIQEVSLNLAHHLIEYAYKNNLARFQPEPVNKDLFLNTMLYSPEYQCGTSPNASRM